MEPLKTENFKFMQHKECEFFPCHKTDKPEDFSCLFCYCPLYALGDKCGGNFNYDNPMGVKDCSNCTLPHVRGNYEYINGKFQEIQDVVKKNHK